MKALTHWAIHTRHKMRLAGRSPQEIWGHLVNTEGALTPFRYSRQTRRLLLGDGPEQRQLQLDPYGLEVSLGDPDQGELRE